MITIKEFRTMRLLHQSLNFSPKGFLGKTMDKICRMGKTGTGAAHSHIEIAFGKHTHLSLTKFNNGTLVPDQKLLYKFVNDRLFGVTPIITTHFLEPGYESIFGIKHPALDVVPENRHQTADNFDMYWSFDCPFEVADCGVYTDGTKWLLIWFEWEEGMDTLKLEDWQWTMLYKTFEELENKHILTSATWREKAMTKNLSIEELTWLNTIIIGRIIK